MFLDRGALRGDHIPDLERSLAIDVACLVVAAVVIERVAVVGHFLSVVRHGQQRGVHARAGLRRWLERRPSGRASRVDAGASGDVLRVESGGSRKPNAAELLATPGALLSRTHLRELGLERRAVDAVFRACPEIILPGYSRPLIRVSDYLRLLEASTYADDRVRPAA